MIDIVAGLVQGIGASKRGAVAILSAFVAVVFALYGKDTTIGLIGFVGFGLLAIAMLIWGGISFLLYAIREAKNNKPERH